VNVSLRVRVFLLVAAFNAALFAAGGVYLGGRAKQASSELAEILVDGVRANVETGQAKLNVAPLLRWDTWSVLEDALLVDRNVETTADGVVLSRGIQLNPVGAVGRDAGHDRQEVLRALVQAMELRDPIAVAGGRAVPIVVDGVTWGACWLRLPPPADPQAMLESLLPLFVLTTILLTFGTFWFLERVVLVPVRRLARGAKRVSAGDFDVQLEEPQHRDEIAVLVSAFNEMTRTVRTFNERLEEEVLNATDQARRAEAAAMTQRRLAAMGELAAGIAHEINNPLGGLENAVVRLGRGDLPPEKRDQYLELLAEGLRRIGGTVARLRRFTPRDGPHAPVDVLAVARDSVALLRHRADRLGVRLDLQLPDGELWIQGGQNELGQALLNLLGNSLDAHEEGASADPGGPRVELVVTPEPDGVTIVVRDNGPGARPDVLARASDLFYTTKDVGKGTGLGLALVHATVREHGGRVRIESDTGAGFEVRIWLPRERGETEG
jgi:signal transduction histidine kinase